MQQQLQQQHHGHPEQQCQLGTSPFSGVPVMSNSSSLHTDTDVSATQPALSAPALVVRGGSGGSQGLPLPVTGAVRFVG